MLKSRRGLLAAGLAVAVVGAIGVASTLNAGAEQISGAARQQPVAGTPTDDADKLATPPSVLPWGSRPTTLKRGAAGASSKSLRDSGAAAAPADKSGSTTPHGRYAPKGGGNAKKFLKSEPLDGFLPPEPPGSGNSDDAYFNYDVASQGATADGMYANLYIAKPYLAPEDYHSLAEVVVQSGSEDENAQKIEVGWTVDRNVNKGSEDPHLFIYYWINNEGICYNDCGFVQYSKTVWPGSTLPTGAAKKFGIQYADGLWWIAYDTEWVGYFPATLWSDQNVKFTQGGFFQAFGEVASKNKVPCTDMGTGKDASLSTSAYIGTFTLVNTSSTPAPTAAPYIRPFPGKEENTKEDPNSYPVYPTNALSSRTFRYGGGGSTSTTCADVAK
ncbi:neprosin family prolyl endopeptidase [Actinoplanes sp. NPDC026619]|uniref:neprosin family prolyl endopeptidase n=1 Tax=Actinoplanes sp. NPDC026619 TaxID=3155798 RepID=UPI0033E247FB